MFPTASASWHRLPTITASFATAPLSKADAWPISTGHTVRGIVGQELQRVDHKVGRECTVECCLKVEGLSRNGEFEDISLHVHHGEILGIYGLMGSGRSEFLNCLYGLTTPDAGSVTLQGKPLPVGLPKATIRAGVSLVTEDRKDSGLVLSGSILSTSRCRLTAGCRTGR